MFTKPSLLSNMDFPKCSLVETIHRVEKKHFLFIKSLVRRNPPLLLMFQWYLTFMVLI